MNLHKLAQKRIAVNLIAHSQKNHEVFVVIGVTEAVDARHTGNYDDIAPLQQRRRGAMAQAVYLIIDRGVFFYVGVGVGNVCLGLIVVIVAYKIFHCIVGEKFLELTAQLCRKNFVVSKH